MKATPKTLVLLFNLMSLTVLAQDTRQHGTHLHGLAELNIAVEQNRVFLEWVTPSNNLLGFEHEPASAEDEQKLDNALKQLKQPDTLFAFTPSAQCESESASIDSSLVNSKDANVSEHSDEHEDDHEDEHADEHEHEDEHEDEHADEHEHDESHDTETHSSFNIQYQFSCENPQDLALIEVTLFDHFPLTEKLQVQVLSSSAQTSKTLTPDNTKIDL